MLLSVKPLNLHKRHRSAYGPFIKEQEIKIKGRHAPDYLTAVKASCLPQPD
jgi:hypothetical protein